MKQFVSIFCISLLIVSLFSSCGALEEETDPAESVSDNITVSADVRSGEAISIPVDASAWTVLVYLCGTDLETEDGCASSNILEMMSVPSLEDVNVVIQTGGTEKWQMEGIDPDVLQRWVIRDNKLELSDTQPLASMGESNTLGDFLKWGVESYPAEKYGSIIWNHGGGSVSGVAFDELFDNDMLDLKELSSGLAMAGKRFELVGFDACLMSTFEIAAALSPYAHYMVASQEVEPGAGWDYAGWLSYLSQNTAATGLEVGKAICDNYLAKCTADESEDLATMAVTDLSKIPALVTAFDDMAAEMKGVASSPEAVKPLSQALVRAENYGGNNDSEGYTNMVDLGDLALRAKGVVSDTGEAVLDALFAAVPYHIKGPGRGNANGLSVFVPLYPDVERMDAYAQLAAVSGEYLRFLEGMYHWKIPAGVVINQPIAQADTTTAPTTTEVQVDNLTIAQSLNAKDYKLSFTTELTDDGLIKLMVNSGSEIIQSVGYSLYFLDDEGTTLNYLGTDFDVNSNDEGTQYWDNFRNVWPMINGNICSMTALDMNEEYILYTVPVKLNGKVTNLRMLYYYETSTYEVLGIWDGIDSTTGMSSRNVQKLKDGDKVELIFTATNLDDTDVAADALIFTSGGFTVSGDLVVEETELFEGVFAYAYKITDIFGKVYESDYALLTSLNGEISVEILE